MLYRISSFQEMFFSKIKMTEQNRINKLLIAASRMSNDMLDYKDYLALATLLIYHKPKIVFEIGTYLGVTSNLILELLPTSKVISISYPKRILNFYRKQKYNNSDLSRMMIGSKIGRQNVDRYYQLYGDSHKLKSKNFIKKYGKVDFVFIDGDHSSFGVMKDTNLALELIHHLGTICWHDANPVNECLEVRKYLENMPIKAIATEDDYYGGIACWNKNIEKKINEIILV